MEDPGNSQAVQPSARQVFLNVWEQLRSEILADPMLSQRDAAEWMSKMMDHNVPGGKLNRGMAVKDVLLALKPDASEEDQLRADQLGWCTEFLQVCVPFQTVSIVRMKTTLSGLLTVIT